MTIQYITQYDWLYGLVYKYESTYFGLTFLFEPLFQYSIFILLPDSLLVLLWIGHSCEPKTSKFGMSFTLFKNIIHLSNRSIYELSMTINLMIITVCLSYITSPIIIGLILYSIIMSILILSREVMILSTKWLYFL